MPSISQNARYRESLLKYAARHGVAKASRKYNEHPSLIYRWRKRWNESSRDIKSLEDTSKRPHSHPNQHTEAELTLIRNLRRRNPNIGLTDLWLRLRARGYGRTVQGLAKGLKQLGVPTNPKTSPSPTCKPKPYEQMRYPGQRVQIDVKYVPRDCIDSKLLDTAPYTRFFQYTAIDEYSRLRILEGYDEHDTYSSSLFLRQVVSFFKARGITVGCV